MRRRLIAISILLAMGGAVAADVSVGIGISVPGLSIGINVPSYPRLVRVPGYPVYYAPSVQANFFFYDGMYWVYQEDNWYASSWYNGPWAQVAPMVVPVYLLRVPVRYYRQPPQFFRGGPPDAAPRWDKHWGPSWHEQRRGWDQWDRLAAPAPAPLPRYQQQYRGDRYPPPERQPEVRSQNYRYQPREEAVRQHYEQTTPGRPPGKDHGKREGDDKRGPKGQ